MDFVVVLERHRNVILIFIRVVLAAGVSRLIKEIIIPLLVNWALRTYSTISKSGSLGLLLHLVFVVHEDAAFLKGSQPQIFFCLRVKL